MNKVTQINRALRPEPVHMGQSIASNDEMGQVQDMLRNYVSKEHSQELAAIQAHFKEALAELHAKFDAHTRATDARLISMQNLVDAEKRNSQAAIENLKSLFDGNYHVMRDLATRYDNEQAAVQNELSQGNRTLSERITAVQQDSADKLVELGSSINTAQQEERTRFAQLLRSLADSLQNR